MNPQHLTTLPLLIPYVGLGILVLAVLILFSFAKLPEVTDTDSLNLSEKQVNSIFHQRHFVLAIVAQFLYVAAQTGIGSFFINYTIEVKQLQLTEIQRGLLLGFGGMVIFAIGRLVGSMLMKKANAGNLLGLFALINTLLMLLVIVIHNRLGVIALIGSYFFMSIMFPSHFCIGTSRIRRKNENGIFDTHLDHCWRGGSSCFDGQNRCHKHEHRVYCSIDMFLVHIVLWICRK